MAQQLVNGSRHDGSVTVTIPMSRRYAVVGTPGAGKHHKRGVAAEKKRIAWLRRQHSIGAEHNGYTRYDARVAAMCRNAWVVGLDLPGWHTGWHKPV